MKTTVTARQHGNALQFAAAAAVITAAFIGLPLLAQDTGISTSSVPSSAYGDYIARKFQKTGAEQAQSFDNRFVESNAFDFAAYFSHTCFRPTEYDVAGCQREFGPYWNLKDTLVAGQLKGILAHYKYLAGAEQAVLPKPVTQVNEPKAQNAYTAPVVNDTDLQRKQRDARAKQLWAACQQRSSERTEAGKCYRRNVRLLSQDSWDLDVESNVY